MKYILFIFIISGLTISCSYKEKNSAFSQALDYCELKDNLNDPYCKLGVHQRTLRDIKIIYGHPIDSFEQFRLPLDTCGFEDGAYTEKTLISLFLNLKEKETPPIRCYTWNLGKDIDSNENIWLRIYFVEDEMKQYRAIYGEKARETFFYYE